MIRTALVGQRTDGDEPDTTEIRRLVEATGGRVVGTVTQIRPEHPGTGFGPGKVETIAERVDATGAATFVVDNTLTPNQTVKLEAALGVPVLDRHRVVLEIFADRAQTRRAQLQVELARLRYELPRVREHEDPQLMNIALEKGTRLDDVRARIDELERQLEELPAIDRQWRERRREAGFDLVAIAGYTNAGKTTLLRRLADDLALESDRHDDLAESAAIEDRLFKTLETTTRRATIAGRDVLLTDTVGFLDDLPHWLVESFRGTLAEIEAADAVVLVADVAQPVAELERKLATAAEAIPDTAPTIPVLNKADAVSDDRLRERRQAVAETAPNPVVTSASTADEFEALETRLEEALPGLEQAELELPLSDEAMSVVSRLHDEAASIDVEYGPNSATVAIEGKPRIVGWARSKAAEL
jgi:GTP-binding protein HflX